MRIPLLNFEGAPGVPLLNFKEGPGLPLLNFEGGPEVPGPEIRDPGVLVSLLHPARILGLRMRNFQGIVFI